MSKRLKKIRRITMNEWEYEFGPDVLLVTRTHPSNFHVYVRPKINSGDEIMRGSFGDLNHCIRTLRRKLESK